MVSCACALRPEAQRWNAGTSVHYSGGPGMAGAGPVLSILGLLLVSALFGVLGEHPNPDLGAHPELRSQVGPGATEPRRQPPPKDQRERARAGSLSLGALYTAAIVAFVLFKCLQQAPDEAAVPREEKNKKSSQSEQQLVQLTQQLAQTEEHLNNLMTQLDPLFERVTTLVGTQRELLNAKLKTIHHLLQDCKPGIGVEVPEPEAPIHFPEDLGKEDQEDAGNSQAWEEPINWSSETWNLAPSWEVEQGLRRRWHKTKGPAGNGGRALKV